MSDIATHADFTLADLIDQIVSDNDEGLEEIVIDCPRCGGQGTLRITGSTAPRRCAALNAARPTRSPTTANRARASRSANRRYVALDMGLNDV